jgi:hypothetical protein
MRSGHTEERTMTTLSMDRLETGDVIEMTILGEQMSALVLLATEAAVILDPCDGSTPFVVKCEELVDFRKFEPSI